MPRFGHADLVLRSVAVYDGAGGSPNPFVDAGLAAAVTAPSGRTTLVRGFFDGDGRGGARGDVFRVRVFADEPGTWTWRSLSSTPGLGGKSGSFVCAGELPGVFRRGPVIVDPRFPRSFLHADGTPVYLLAKFLDFAAGKPLHTSHAFFSERVTDAGRRAFLARHRGMRLSYMDVALANRGDNPPYATTPWLGTAAANDKTRFDLARWHLYERWLLALRDAGLAVQLWFFLDDSGFGRLPEADRHRLVEYGMARLSAFAHTLFILALEWQEGWSAEQVARDMDHLHRHNPWARLASVHGVPGDFAFPRAAWADYMDTQPGNSATHQEVHEHTLANRALAGKPLLVEEFGLGQENTAHRRKAWAAFTAGAAGSGTGAFLQHLAAFVARVPFHRMAPAGDLVVSGNAYCLAEPGRTYVFYLPEDGPLRADLREAAGAFAAEWYDPRDGSRHEGGTVTGGGVRAFTPPGGGDWALLIHR